MINNHKSVRWRRIFSCNLLFLIFTLPIMAQDLLVTGKVTDGHLPISGANILIKNTKNGVVSDFDGRYSITAKPTDTLLVSYLGYTTLTIPIQNRTTIDVALQEDATALGEVQINAGYYTTTDREKTGSIARITAKEIETQPISNPMAALQGKMAGVNITQSTGVPGGAFNIQIRGTNSLRADGNTPLYLVDGIPFGTENLGSTLISGAVLTGYGINPLNSLNPKDIESIEVLKDADATAIYGSRGSNGVVLITSKKGKPGKTKLNINSYSGIGSVSRKLKLMNTQQYLIVREQAFINDGFTEIPFYAYDINGTWDRNKYTDWQKELIGGTAYTNSTQATFSGGAENTSFLLSGTHYKETTVFPGDFEFSKKSVSFNINHSSTDQKFELLLSSNYLADTNDLLATDLTRQAYTLAPNAPEPFNSDGTLNWENSTWDNPYRYINEKYLAQNNNLISNAMLQYQPSKEWSLKLGLGFSDSQLQESKASPHTIYDPSYGLSSKESSLTLNDAKMQSWNIEPQIVFHKTILSGTVNALIGTTFQNRTRKQNGLYARGISNNNLIKNLAAASNISALGTNNTEYRYNAVFGRFNYARANKYFLNFTGRRDGSSRFGPGKQFANFWALGAAWLFSEEHIFNQNKSWLSYGKLRGSYGTTGSDQIGDYQFLDTYSLSGLNYQGNTGLKPTRLFNPNFSWETNKKMELAIELGAFNDRLMLSIAHYQNRSSNQLVGIPLPGTTGFPLVTANLDATVQNIGWEFEMQGRIVRSDNLNWTTFLNFTVPKNKLIAFPNLEGSTYRNKFIIGEPLDITKVYHYTGMNPQTGIYEFEDVDGDGLLTSANDRKKIISSAPKFFGGFQNNINYKNWQFDFLFQFTQQLGRNNNYLGDLPGVASNLSVEFNNAWSAVGDESNIQPYSTGINANITTAYNRFTTSDAAFSDASFVRLKNFSISYTLPKSFSSIVESSVNIRGQNLLTITKYNGPDPENQSVRLPPLRIFTFGLDLNF
ncbi:SusC/RagA family TonB-linked outer membrane protein [Gelidibacter mesophilus]|uniref:SusC/RagA family TonB-linked outer membrane protein n=1 Tax=Gelidibacter mesophilus TaxID=169050 RepID=UPI000A046E41|nr:SusC/RagA family TonB-linked outer membrane protein [Gelidibacter mesophilus]